MTLIRAPDLDGGRMGRDFTRGHLSVAQVMTFIAGGTFTGSSTTTNKLPN